MEFVLSSRMNSDGQASPAPGERSRVLLVVYACSPYRASEYAVGWGRAVQAARYYDTWVLCGPDSETDVARYLHEHGPIPGLTFSFLGTDPREEAINRRFPPSILEHNYLAYRLWHRRAFRAAQELHATLGFAVAHQANTCGYREPGEAHRLGIPFVWGPVGGTQNYPWRFLSELPLMSAAREIARNTINALQIRYSRRVRRACARTATLLTANSQGESDFCQHHHMQPIRLLETGLQNIEGSQRARGPSSEPLHILWSGRVHPRKGLSLLIRALAQLPPHVKYTVRIVGDGSERARCMALATQFGISEHCQWLGTLPLDQAMAQYHWADVFVFSSLRDTSGNVVLEAFARGVPVICLDHQGARDMVSAESGIKIPVVSPPQVVAGMAAAITRLHDDRVLLSVLSAGALLRAREFLWDCNGDRLREVYARHIRTPAREPAEPADARMVQGTA